MILYNKRGEFLGIEKEDLSFLGYEDLEEFKSINDDVADLFVNRPGYIFKFKNFSWIDYALHSGAPKKSVILKLKTGNEIETAIKIKEVFLNNPKDNEDIYYCLEFTKSMGQNNPAQTESFIQASPTPSFISPETSDNKTTDFEESPQEKILPQSFESDFEEIVEDKFENDISQDFNQSDDNEEETSFKLKLNNLEEDNQFETKLKIEDDLIQDYVEKEPEISTQSNYEENFHNEEDTVTTPKISLDNSDEDFTIKLKESYEDDTISKEIEVEEESAEFDLLECVEEIGLDIGLVSELITDYITKLDKTIPEIKLAVSEDNEELLKDEVYKLKGISDNLYIHHISNQLVNIINAQSKEEKNIEVDKFDRIVTKFKGEFI